MEVAIPRNDSLYQAYCKYPSPGCVSLLKFDVYKWDGVKYIEATNEFLSVYDEEINLAERFLEDPNIQKDSREKIEKYLKEIDDLKKTADWKTYENKEYGFEFMYPPELILEEKEDEQSSWRDISVFMKSNDFNGYLLVNNAGVGTGFGVEVSSENIEIEGNNIKLEILDSSIDNQRATVVSFSKNNNEYFWLYRFDKKDSNKIEISKRIFSTFKFTEKDETVDWKTYRNEEYGFEMKYPKDWITKDENPRFYFNSASFKDDLGISGFFIRIGSKDYLSLNSRYIYVAKDIEEKEIIVGGIKGIDIVTKEWLKSYRTIYIQKDDKTFVLATINPSINYEEIVDRTKKDKEIKENLKKFDQILSTFKFIESN